MLLDCFGRAPVGYGREAGETRVFRRYSASREGARRPSKVWYHPPMRRLSALTIICAALAFAPGCSKKDPNAIETHTEKLSEPQSRALALGQLTRLAKAVHQSGDKARIDDYAAKAMPAFIEIWDTAPESRMQMLEIALDIGSPEAAGLWEKAVVLDGTGEGYKGALLAMKGIRKAKATATVPSLIKQLDATVDNPSKDKGEREGQARRDYVRTLGELGDKQAVDVLIKTLEVPAADQPRAIHREAIRALGKLGDPKALDAIVLATLRLPDSASSTDVFNRSMLAIVSFGKPGVDAVLEVFEGRNPKALKLAADQGLDDNAVKLIYSRFLGALDDPAAADPLIAFMPREDCSGKGDPDPEAGALRGSIARQLGFIGDERAVGPLCECSLSSQNPGDMDFITEAMGYIGGDDAVACLTNVVTKAEYSDDAIVKPEYKYELRWEGARFLVLAADADDVPTLRKTFETASKDKDVKAGLEKAGWSKGIDLLEKCKKDTKCYATAATDASAEWFEREVAAMQLSRLAPEDGEAAAAIAKAFKVHNPDGRATVALLAQRMARHAECASCADDLQAVLDAEKGSMNAKYQLSVIKVRHALATLAR